MDFGISDSKKIGIGLTGFGLFFLVLGVLLLFDKALLALGNVLFLVGTTLLLGVSATLKFFTRRRKVAATICFFLGIVLVLIGWPIIGMCIEFFGIINLFGNFFGLAIRFAREMPIIGPILRLPFLAKVGSWADQRVDSQAEEDAADAADAAADAADAAAAKSKPVRSRSSIGAGGGESSDAD